MNTTAIVCPNCGITKSVPNEKLPKQPTSISCRSCKEIFKFEPKVVTEHVVTNLQGIKDVITIEEKETGKKSSWGSIILIIFSIPFLKRSISTGLLALQPNIHGATGKAIFFGVLGSIPMFFGIRGLLRNRKMPNKRVNRSE